MDNKLQINPVRSPPRPGRVNEDKAGLPTFFTPGSQAGPVAEVALGRVVPLQHVAVPTLQYREANKIGVFM